MNMKKTITLTLICLSSTLVGAAAYADDDTALTANLGYVQLSSLPAGSNTINPMRLSALQDTATELGATGALAWQSLKIDNSLKQQSEYLNHIFDFNQLLLAHSVLPPVLVEADNTLNLADNNSIRLASKTYKIQSPAQFVTAPPTWQQYLWMDYPQPSTPDHTLLPTTQAEANVWNSALKKGWEQGINQANQIFSVNLNRLKRDYTGIILYRKLLAQHMVSAPYVAKSDLGVTGDSNQIRINDQVLRITSSSKLQVNSSKWSPVIMK